MAGKSHPIIPRVMGAKLLHLSSRPVRCEARFSLQTSAVKEEGPSCLFVGPIETASQETLEALYRQARDSYYSGKPLILDDMFDRVELKLRWYGSKSIIKYPRCSIKRQAAYSDAEEDISQVVALASIWVLIFVFGCSISLMPVSSTVQAFQHVFSLEVHYGSQAASLESLAIVNGILFTALGSLIGYQLASAAVSVLHRLWRNDLVALKGACPNCGEEVFAFVKTDKPNDPPHRADCHVCDRTLEFRTTAEQSVSRLGRRWVYGRVYLVSRRGNRYQRWI